MTDRVIVYPSAIPVDTDILSTNRNMMIAIGNVAESCIGSGTALSGLACTPVTGTLSVSIARGTIFSLQTVDSISYGSLGTDTDPLFKVGINTQPTVFSFTAPTTTNTVQTWLIEAQLIEVATGSSVLNYYNASNPATPYTGPGNSGTSQNTAITQRVQFQVKTNGPIANTGVASNTPGADAGWVPLYVVSVAYGQTAITSANISPAAGAPLLLAQLSTLRHICTAPLKIYVNQYGSDSNGGLQASDAFATLQAAWNSLVTDYDLNGYNATIQVAAGTYAPLVANGNPVGLGTANVVFISGAGAASTFIQSTSGSQAAISAQNATVYVTSLTIEGYYGLVSYTNAQIYVKSGVTFAACSLGHAYAEGGQIIFQSNYTISGNAPWHWATRATGTITVAAITITLTGTPAFSTAFAYATTGCIDLFISGTVTFSGSATGSHYNISLGGAVNTGSGNTSFLPGSSAGTIASSPNGGFYA